MNPLYLFDLGKKMHPGTLVLVKTDKGYISFEQHLKTIKKHVANYPIPESLVNDVRKHLLESGYKTSIASFEESDQNSL